MGLKILKMMSLIAVAGSLAACGSPTKEENSDVAASGSGVSFNLGQHLQNSGIRPPGKMEFNSNGIGVGGPTSFQVFNNFTISSANQSVAAQYYIDAIVLKKKIGSGHTVDLTAAARLGTVGAEVNFRVLGQTLYSMKKSTEMNYSFVRDIGVTLPYPILPALSLELGGNVGGEVGFKVAPGLSRDSSTAGINVSPYAGLHGNIKAGFSAVFVKAGAVGTAKIIDAGMTASAGIGRKSDGRIYGSLKFEPLSIDALGGGIDLVASLGVGNILPGEAGRLWQKVFKNTPFGNFEWSYPLVKYPPINALRTPAKELQF